MAVPTQNPITLSLSELQVLINMKANVDALQKQLDAFIKAHAPVPKPKNSPEVQARLDLAEKADRLKASWQKVLGTALPHATAEAWIDKYGSEEVALVANKAVAKHRKETMSASHQVSYVELLLNSRKRERDKDSKWVADKTDIAPSFTDTGMKDVPIRL